MLLQELFETRGRAFVDLALRKQVPSVPDDGFRQIRRFSMEIHALRVPHRGGEEHQIEQKKQ
jgi:hypothetical protein